MFFWIWLLFTFKRTSFLITFVLKIEAFKKRENVPLTRYIFHQKDCKKIQNTFDIESWLPKSDLGWLWWLVWKSVKVESKFLQNVTSSWPLFSKLHHWGHSIVLSLGRHCDFFRNLMGLKMLKEAAQPHLGSIWYH